MTSDLLPVASPASAAPPVPTQSSAEPAAFEVDDLIASLRPRLADTVGAAEVDRFVREALADLGAVRVTTYLPILIERRVRQRVRAESTVSAVEFDARVARVTA